MVHADVMMNPDGTSKGWGVVQFASAQDALNAIQVGGSGWGAGRVGAGIYQLKWRGVLAVVLRMGLGS